MGKKYLNTLSLFIKFLSITLCLWDLNAYSKLTFITKEENEKAEKFLKSKDLKTIQEMSGNYSRGDNVIYSLRTKYIKNDDSALRFKYGPFAQARHIIRTSDKIIYDATYTIDSVGRRINPLDNSSNENKESFIILHGCSFTFGSGLNDDQTLSHFLNKEAIKYKVYNYAIEGSAPNMMLAQLQEIDLSAQIKEDQGFFVYIYTRGHIFRANAFMIERSWMASTPVFEKRGSELIKKGSFEEEEPFLTSLYDILYTVLEIHKIFNTNFPPLLNRHLDYFCSLVAASKDEFLKKYPNSEFLMVHHPLYKEIDERLITCLQKKKVKVVDLNLKTIDGHQIVGDGHPSEELNKLFAKKLNDYLRDL